MRIPTKMHDSGCPGSIQETGLPPAGRCRCDVATSIAPTGVEGRLHLKDDKRGSSLVSFAGYAPAWFESKGLVESTHTDPTRMTEDGPESPVDIDTGDELDDRPLDIRLLNGWTKKNGNPKYGRRRRPVIGGELVFVRSERIKGTFTPWRFVFCTRRSGEHVAVLIRPELYPEAAVSPDWSDVRCVPMTEGQHEPHRVLFPVFPLPDGQEDPGWRKT